MTFQLNEKDLARFWRSVEKHDTGCWIFHKPRKPDTASRPGFHWDGKNAPAAVIMWQLMNGAIPKTGKKFCVCHTCDNGQCVRPDHLFLGTYRDNQVDSIRKGRCPRQTIQTAKIVTELYAGARQSDLARKYGLTRQRIHLIAKSATYEALT